MPDRFDLHQNFPNPFNPDTRIRYQLPEASHVQLVIFNALGQRIKTLVDQDKDAGWYLEKWDGRDDHGGLVGSGVYFVKLKAGSFSKIQKMMLIQ